MPLLHGDENYERKLRPIYDALDARSWKQAAKLADAALKKYKGDQLVRALKGYALHRSGKPEEALQLMRDIVVEGPEAERVVMTMAYTYKAAGQPEGITQAYAAAAEKLPRDPEVLAGLFRSYVREFNFVKQQQVAMRLSKLAPAGSPEAANCAWWIVCSLALQARAALRAQDDRGVPLAAGATDSGGGSTGGLAPEKLLQLAETMAARQVAAAGAAKPGGSGASSGKAAPGLSFEALLLHLDILQGQGKAAAALAALEGPAGAAVPLAADRLQLRAAALVRAGDLSAAAACYLQAVASSPDDWLSWQLYLDCMLPGSGDGSGGAPGTTGSTGGSRFPVGVVGGLADSWDRRRAAGTAAAGAPAVAPDAASVAAVEEAVRQLSDAVAANDSWARQLAAGTLRSPHLWGCETLLRRHRLAAAVGNSTAAAALQCELAAAVGAAFARLSGNFSCVADLRPYLAVLEGPVAQQLAARAHELAVEGNAADEAAGAASSSSAEGASGSGGAASAAAENGGEGSNGTANGGSGEAGPKGGTRGVSAQVRRLQRVVNAHQLEAELGLPANASPVEAEAHAAALLSLYADHMHLSDALDEKERGHGEELVALAVEALMRATALEGGQGLPERQERRMARMLQALLVLEAAQQRRKVSAPLRLAATALYSLLAAPGPAAAQLAALDIKSILHDSMTSHWLLPLLSGMLPLVAALPAEGQPDLRKWIEGCCALHELHQQEAGETLGTALQHGTYSKVPEFVDFKERLQHSHARALASVLQSLLPPRSAAAAGSAHPAGAPLQSLFPAGTAKGLRQALQHARALLAAAAAGSAEPALRFNEDLSTRPSWYPPGSASSAAVADWWHQADAVQQAQQPPDGYARCWWAATLAAEGGSPGAAAWRSRCVSELRARVAWALAASASLDSAADAAALAEQLRPLVPAGSSEPAAEDGSPAVQAAACRATLALLQQLAGAVGSNADPGLQAASDLASACSAAGKRAAGELAAAQAMPLLPGSAITTAAALVSDCASVSAVFQRLKKLAGKGRPELAAAAGEAASAADAAAAEVKAAAAAALAACDQEQRIEAAAQLVQLDGGEEAGARLWGFEPSLEARGVLAGLVRSQGAVLASLK